MASGDDAAAPGRRRDSHATPVDRDAHHGDDASVGADNADRELESPIIYRPTRPRSSRLSHVGAWHRLFNGGPCGEPSGCRFPVGRSFQPRTVPPPRLESGKRSSRPLQESSPCTSPATPGRTSASRARRPRRPRLSFAPSSAPPSSTGRRLPTLRINSPRLKPEATTSLAGCTGAALLPSA